jgi:hypothetical protein
VYEEMFIDTMIEHYTERIVSSFGGDSELAGHIANFICSFREAFLGVGKFVLGLGKSSSGGEVKINIKQDSKVNVNKENAIDLATKQEQKSKLDMINKWADNTQKGYEREAKKNVFSSLFEAENIIGFVLSLPGMFVGGLGLGAMSLLAGATNDIINSVAQKAFLQKKLPEIQHYLGELQQTIQDAKETIRKAFPAQTDIVMAENMLAQMMLAPFIQQVPEINNDLKRMQKVMGLAFSSFETIQFMTSQINEFNALLDKKI